MPKHAALFHVSTIALLFVVCPNVIQAQSQTPVTPPVPGSFNSDDGMAFAKIMQSDMELLMELEMELGGRVAKELPFSAQVSLETEQVLGDGTHLSRKTGGSLYRDSLGRLRQELRLSLPAPMPASAEIGTIVVISDPNTGAHWTLMPAAKMAMKMTMPAAGSRHKMNANLNTEKNFGIFDGSGEGGRTEDLGAQNMEGLTATGSRFTHVIPAGQLGNDQPLQVVTERWYSSEMHMPVFLKRSDPMTGSKTLKVTDVRRVEPDAALFNIPADYAVREMMIPTDADTQPKKPSQP
jgi:hypothetical protein